MKKITTLLQLHRAASRRRSVMLSTLPNPIPAAFILSMPARTVFLYMHRGMTLYEKKATAKAKEATS